MNWLISILEALDGKVFPGVMLTVLAALGLYSYYRYFSARNFARASMSSSSNASQSATRISELQSKWIANRDYTDALRAGPTPSGAFRGWFADEMKICGEFRDAKTELENQREIRQKEHPKTAERYLAVVREEERKPHTIWVYVGLLFLMAVEATGFSLIFADRLSDTASAQAVERYAYGIAIVLAFLALLFAHYTGVAVYRQRYAREAHLLAPNRSLQRTSDRALGMEDDEVDGQAHQSIRIANRSEHVTTAAAKASHSNRMTPLFPTIFWVYGAVVLLFGCLIAFTRVGQIDEFYAKEAKKAFEVEKATVQAEEPRGAVRPPAVAQSARDAEAVVTQEAVDVERRGKIMAISVFVAIFYIVQALGVVLAAGRGFASTQGEAAYRRVQEFRRKHGNLTFEQYCLKIDKEIQSADRFAQDTLHSWQIGLQTAFGNKAMKVPDEKFFERMVTDFSTRTYESYFLAKPAEVVTSQEKIRFRESSEPMSSNGSESMVDYFVKSVQGGESLATSALSDLRIKVADGDLDPSLLMLRPAGEPGRYLSYTEFMKASKAAAA